MDKLITRKIDPLIEKINKAILISALLLFFISLVYSYEASPIFFNIIYIFVIIFGITVAIYELHIYKENKKFINIFKENKYQMQYIIMMKYYKIILFLFICSTVIILKGVFPLGISAIGIFNLFFLFLVMYSIITEYTIVNTSFLVIILKYFVIIICSQILFHIYSDNINSIFRGNSIPYFPIYIEEILVIAIMLQITYLLINLNTYYLSKRENKKSSVNYINKGLIINIFLLVVYELIICIPKVFINQEMNLQFVIRSTIGLLLVLLINFELQKKIKLKRTKYTKVVEIYFVFMLVVLPLVMTVEINILMFIFLQWINAILIILYQKKNKIYKINMLNRISDAYDNWY